MKADKYYSLRKALNNFSKIFFGIGLSQALAILNIIIISKFYSPNNFGLYSIWLGIAIVLSIIFTLRFEAFLPLEKKDARIESLTCAFFVLLVMTALFLISYLLLLFFGYRVDSNSDSTLLILIAILTAFFMGATQLSQAYLVSEGLYKKLAFFRINQAFFIFIFQGLCVLIFKDKVLLLFASLTFGIFLSFFSFLWWFPITLKSFKFNHLLLNTIHFMKRNHQYPLLSLPADLINSFAVQLPIWLTAFFYGSHNAGLVSFAQKLLAAPVAIIAAAFLDLFKREASISYASKGHIKDEFYFYLRILSFGSILFCVTFFLVVPNLISSFFSSEWSEVSGIFNILLPIYGLRFISSPLSFVFYIFNKQHIDLFLQILLVVFVLLSFVGFKTFNNSLSAYTISYSLFYVIYLILEIKFIKKIKKSL
jgi:O-antigen/teichoic acid export membrane protein